MQDFFQHLSPATSPIVQANAAKELSERLLGKFSKRFSIFVDPNLGNGKDAFKLRKSSVGTIIIHGSCGASATWGLHYYLKNFCNVHISWEGSQLELPNTFPEVDLTITSNDRFRYYQNVCTGGYSTVWWQWKHWEKHIDWMALNGINLSLAFLGQEAIWEKVYLEMNLTREEINQHFGGPAFLPWSRMGNIRGWGGPLTSSWHAHTVSLQHRILRRMRDLGMTSVLPAFAGHIPRAFATHFPNAVMTKVGVWNDFEDSYCCPYMLEPTDPLFQTLGTKYLRKLVEEFGSDHIYSCDAFNENEPSSAALPYLRNTGNAIFNAMKSVDPEAVWLMQGWLFVHDILYWTESRVEAFITSVPIGRMIILDLQSEQFPQYKKFKSYYGQPFIWCMLHNFGGTLGMFGSAEIINQIMAKSLATQEEERVLKNFKKMKEELIVSNVKKMKEDLIRLEKEIEEEMKKLKLKEEQVQKKKKKFFNLKKVLTLIRENDARIEEEARKEKEEKTKMVREEQRKEETGKKKLKENQWLLEEEEMFKKRRKEE